MALEREYDSLIKEINSFKAATPEDVWRLYNILREKKREIGSKYEYRYSTLLLLFARLVNEGLLSAEEVESLGEKADAIKELLRINI